MKVSISNISLGLFSLYVTIKEKRKTYSSRKVFQKTFNLLCHFFFSFESDEWRKKYVLHTSCRCHIFFLFNSFLFLREIFHKFRKEKMKEFSIENIAHVC